MHARSLILSLTLVAVSPSLSLGASVAAQQVADTAVTRTIAPAPERITLSDAVTRAVRVQPATVQARGNIRNADAQQRSAYAAFLPNLNATTSAGSTVTQSNDALDARTRKSVNTGLSASVDLWTGLRRGADIAAANAADRSAEAGL